MMARGRLLLFTASFVAGLLLPLPRVANKPVVVYIHSVSIQGDIMEETNTVSIDMTVEELESRIAPDGGETVLPLSTLIKHGHR